MQSHHHLTRNSQKVNWCCSNLAELRRPCRSPLRFPHSGAPSSISPLAPSRGLPWLRSPCNGKQELFFRVQTSWLLIREEAYWTSSSAFSSQWNWKKKYLLSAQLCRWNLKRFRARKEWAQDDSRRNLFLHFSMISLHFCRAGRQQIGCMKWNLYRQERLTNFPNTLWLLHLGLLLPLNLL